MRPTRGVSRRDVPASHNQTLWSWVRARAQPWLRPSQSRLARGAPWLGGAWWALLAVLWLAWLMAAPYVARGMRRARARIGQWSAILLARWLAARQWVMSAWLSIRLSARPRLAGLAAALRQTPRWLWRAARAACARMGQAPQEDAGDLDELEIREDDLTSDGLADSRGAPMWVSRLAPRARVTRAALIAGTVGLALFVVLGGPSSALDGLRQWASSLAPPPATAAPRPQLNASFWAARRVPYAALHVRGITLAPSAAASDVAYACWVDRHAAPSGASVVNLYLTTDGARSWSALPAPPGAAGQCQIVPDAADAQRLLFVLLPPRGDTCAPPRVYDSANRGATWQAVAAPAALANACDLTFFQVRGALYAWSPAAQAGGGPAAHLLTSSDEGVTWQPVFDGAEAGGAVALVAAHASGALLVLAGASGRAQRTLWCRATPGAPWQSLGALPPGTNAAFAADGQHTESGCSWGTLYAAGYGPGSDPTTLRLEIRSGQGWKMVPPLPIPAAAGNLPLGGDGHILSVGPDGILLVATNYSGPGVGVTAGGTSPAHTIWGWEPRTGRWLTDIHIEPANSTIDGFIWDESQPGPPRLICWVYTLNGGIPAFTGVFRAAFAATSAPAQDAGDHRAPGL